MIRTVKPPPKVNPYKGGHSPEGLHETPSNDADYSQEQYSNNRYDKDFRVEDPTPLNYGLDNFDFEAAVQEEMRKMEQEVRSNIPAAAEAPVKRPSYNVPDHQSSRYDVFEVPVRALDQGSPIKLSVVNEPNGDLFDSSIDAVVGEKNSDIRSPGRRKGGAISTMYGDRDNRMNQKAAKAAEYANFLQQQIEEKKAAKERERQELREAPASYEPRQPPKKNTEYPPNPTYERESHEYHSPAREYQPPVQSHDPSIRARYPEDSAEDLDRLRRMQSHLNHGDGYTPSGWGQQPDAQRQAHRQLGNMENLNLQNNIISQQNNQSSPAVHPAPAAIQRPPPGNDFLSHAPPRESYVSPERHNQQNFISPAGGSGGGSDEKAIKKQKQHAYRLMLERQMQEQNEQKKHMKAFWKGEDVPPDVTEAIKSQGLKHMALRTNRDSNSHQDEPQSNPAQRGNDPRGGYHDGNNEYHDPNLSPQKVSVARNRLIQDVFGNSDMLGGNSKHPVGSPDKDSWKPSERGGVSKRGMAANDYKAILDAQMTERARIKEEEKKKAKEEEEKDRLKMLEEKHELEMQQEADLRKKRALEAEEEEAMFQREELKLQQMQAKKHPNRGSKDSAASEAPPSRPSSGEKRRDSYNAKFSPDRHHLDVIAEYDDASVSPRDSYISEQLKAPKTPPRFSRVNLGDGAANQNRKMDFRKLEEEVQVEERGATPGGALACNSSLVPIRDSGSGGNHPIRNSGASNVSYSSQWKAQAQNSRYHQHHPHANFRPDIPRYDPSQDEEDDAIVVAWQEELNRRAREENFATSPKLLRPQEQASSPNSYGHRSNQRASRSSESHRVRNINGPSAGIHDDPWGPLGILSALGDRGRGPVNIDQRPTKSRISDNVAEQSLASESFLTYIDNRRPMTQATRATAESINTDGSTGYRPQNNNNRVPGSPLESMLQRDATEQERRSADRKKREKYQRPYYEDDSVASSQYDSLNHLLRNSEERAGKDLFDVAAEVPRAYHRKAPVKKNLGYREEYNTDDGYLYSDDEELLVIG